MLFSVIDSPLRPRAPTAPISWIIYYQLFPFSGWSRPTLRSPLLVVQFTVWQGLDRHIWNCNTCDALVVSATYMEIHIQVTRLICMLCWRDILYLPLPGRYYWMDFNKTWWEDGEWAEEKSIYFLYGSGKRGRCRPDWDSLWFLSK